MAYQTYFPRTSNNDRAIEEWAKGLIDKWLDKMEMLGIHDTGFLTRSFRYMVEWETRSVNGGMDVEFLKKVEFLYAFYGKLVDYGVGRGMTIQQRFERGSNHDGKRRKRKKWIDDPFLATRGELLRIINQQAISRTKAIMRTRFEDKGEVVFITKTKN